MSGVVEVVVGCVVVLWVAEVENEPLGVGAASPPHRHQLELGGVGGGGAVCVMPCTRVGEGAARSGDTGAEAAGCVRVGLGLRGGCAAPEGAGVAEGPASGEATPGGAGACASVLPLLAPAPPPIAPGTAGASAAGACACARGAGAAAVRVGVGPAGCAPVVLPSRALVTLASLSAVCGCGCSCCRRCSRVALGGGRAPMEGVAPEGRGGWVKGEVSLVRGLEGGEGATAVELGV